MIDKIINNFKELVSNNILLVNKFIILLLNNATIYITNNTILCDNIYAKSPKNTEKPILLLFFYNPILFLKTHTV